MHKRHDLNGHRLKSPFCSLYRQVKQTQPLQLLLSSAIIFTPHILSKKVVVFHKYKKKPCVYTVSGYQKTCNKAFYYSFYYKAAENRGKQRTTEDNGTFTEYREKAQKRYVSGLLKWLYYIIHEHVIYLGKTGITFIHLSFLLHRLQ